MLKVVEVCSRVEGHGNVNLFINNQKDEISHVDFEIRAYRGFEDILIGKKLIDIPKITSRICGLCHASQSIVSCKTIESIYDIGPSERSILLRRLLLAGELIKSHSMHFFFQSFPDLLKIFNIKQKIPSLYELINYNPQLTTNFYELIKIGNDINKIFGARSVHLISPIPGGMVYTPSRKNINITRKYVQKAIINLEWIIEKFIELFSTQTPPIDFELPNLTYFGLHNNGSYDRYSGILGMKQNSMKAVNFLAKDYSTYFDKDPGLRGINFENEENILVGPFARNKLIERYPSDEVSNYFSYFDKQWHNNLLFTNFIRLIEMYVDSQQILEILDDPNLGNKEILPVLNSKKHNEGIGVVEAPRGTLMHHYYIKENDIIAKVKLFIATEINIPLINEMITQYAQKLYEKQDINAVKEEIQVMIRAFDPCISCATH
ncbi:MAG: nickel-dependent hydrogenase large subunit [Promethearchaeota archaeon]